MDIFTEYKRMQALAATVAGIKEIEDAWMVLTTHEKSIDGYWQKRSESFGDGVVGFAIDPESMRVTVGSNRYNHQDAYLKLWNELALKGIDIDEITHRVIKGWSGKILDFKFPCILLSDWRLLKANDDTNLLDRIELFILDQGLGLPLNGFFRRLHE